MFKKCRACCEEKPISQYGVDKGFKDGFKSKCKICLKTKNKNICDELVGESKICKVCGEDKDLSKFRKRSDRHYKFENKCRDCAKEGKYIDNLIYKDGLKLCSHCKEYFDLSNFNVYRNKVNCTCKKCEKLRNKLYRDSLDKEVKRDRKNKEYVKNKKDYLRRSKEWVSNNPEKVSETRKIYSKNLRNTNFLLYLRRNVSSNIRMRLNTKYDKRTHTILKCSIEEFKNHIEKQFLSWMNWDNYGKNKYPTKFNESWDLDHIIPISFAKNPEEIITLNHWSNFQPLCARYNRYIKRDTIPLISNIDLKITTNNINNE